MAILDQIKPCDTDQPYVFISYSSLDRELVWQDVQEYQRRGYNVWLDDRNIDKTKASWKEDALAAIEDYCCALVVFYVSAWSLTSGACYDELCHTRAEDTVAYHNSEVKYIAVEVERIEDIGDYRDEVHKNLMKGTADKKEKQACAKILHCFVRDFFDTNNEKVRVHPKNEPNRKMNYYDEVTASFPDETRIYAAAPVQRKEVEEKKLGVEPMKVPVAEPVVRKKESEPVMTPEEMYELGKKYYHGEGVLEDKSEAVKWYRKAAEQGCAAAQNNLGACYLYGTSISKDETEAVKWFWKAAEQGHAAAQNNLGICYLSGTGIPKDESEAEKWFREAAEQGEAIAQYNLASCYYFGNGVSMDRAQALKWFQLAAEQGNADAQYRVGDYYYFGDGIPKDVVEAVKWYRKAAEQGNADAQFSLGLCYRLGIGISRDTDEAVKWYRKGADQEHAGAQYSLGYCYYYGYGVSKNIVEAASLYLKAAIQGHTDAMCRLAECYLKGDGVSKNKSMAIEWYRKAAERGELGAKKKLRKLTFGF